MKQLFVVLARYNVHANTKMFEILEKTPDDLRTKDSGSHFDSILGVLNHTLMADLGWLNGYRRSDLELAALDTPVLDFDHPGPGNPLYATLPELWERRKQVDAVFSALAEEVTEEQLAGNVTLSRPGGASRTFVFGEALLHLFNHQTHHRGAVAQMLDGAGIENDYSNVLAVLG